MTHPLYEHWKRARENLVQVDADPWATPTEKIRAEAEFIVASIECDRRISEMERMETMQALTVTRLRALDSMAEAARTFVDMPDLLCDVADQIAANAELESNLIFQSWVPGPGERQN